MAKRQTTVTRVPVPNMLGGVTRLPPALRAPNQLQDAENVTLHLARGLEKRPGTEYIKPGTTGDFYSGLVVDDFTRTSTTLHFHWVDRDADEKYLMVFNGDTDATPANRVPLEIFNVTDDANAIKCTVTYDAGTSTALKTYLSTLDGGKLKLRTITSEDTTIVLNQAVTAALSAVDPAAAPYQSADGKNVEVYASTNNRLAVFSPVLSTTGNNQGDGFPQPPTSANGVNDYWYARTSEGGFPSGWYKATSTSEWPWYTRVATPFVESEFDRATMPIRIRNTAKNTFEVEQIPWKDRLSGNPALNAKPSFVGKKLTDLAIHRGRLWLAAGEQLCASRTNDLYNFWIDDYQLLRDDDRIDITIGSGKVNVISHLVTFAKALVVFTDADQQFEIRGEPIISPTNVAVLPTTNYGAAACAPVVTNRQLYAPVTKGTATQVHEYVYDEQAANNISIDIAAPVERWLPSDIRQIVASKTGDVLFLRSGYNGHSTNIYVHNMVFSGNERVQSAWSKWTFNSDSVIQSMQVFEDWLYILFKRQLFYTSGTYAKEYQFWVERMRIRNLDNVYQNDATTELLFEPRLDRQYEILKDGTTTDYWSYDATNIETTLKLPFYDEIYDRETGKCNVIISLDTNKAKADTIAGTVFIPDIAKVTYSNVGGTQTWTHITIPGNYGNGTRFIIGRPYTGSITMSELFMRDENNTPVIGTLQVKQISVVHDDTSYMAFAVTPESRSTYTAEYTGKYVGSYYPNDVAVSNDEITHFKVMASADHTTMKITNDKPVPMRVSSLEYLVNFIPYKRSGAF